ncbi:uncharacterized protein LOC126081068 [Elephas maximus indicus]|uniref:uncharacterized protein LOC126081068 n=1 Tax=Elephas maximus indicus TaxID=99487 RepID=UPI002116827F|nr:uncharacterized protein LOC126081068 [Elephas maximus indicus]
MPAKRHSPQACLLSNLCLSGTGRTEAALPIIRPSRLLPHLGQSLWIPGSCSARAEGSPGGIGPWDSALRLSLAQGATYGSLVSLALSVGVLLSHCEHGAAEGAGDSRLPGRLLLWDTPRNNQLGSLSDSPHTGQNDEGEDGADSHWHPEFKPQHPAWQSCRESPAHPAQQQHQGARPPKPPSTRWVAPGHRVPCHSQYQPTEHKEVNALNRRNFFVLCKSQHMIYY